LEPERSLFSRYGAAPLSEPISSQNPANREKQAPIPKSEKTKAIMQAPGKVIYRPAMRSVPKKLTVASSLATLGAVMETYTGGHVKSATYVSGYGTLPSLFNSPDEQETQVRVQGEEVYVARKTTMKKAAELIGQSATLSENFAQIVACFAKESGSCYVICRLERAGTLDASLVKSARALGNPRLRYINQKSMGMQERNSACRAIVRRISKLHRSGMLLGRFRTGSVAFYGNFEDALFTDPRFVCPAGNSSLPEAMLSMAVLKLSGLLEEGQILPLARYYLLEGGFSQEAGRYFSDKTNLDKKTERTYSELYARQYGKHVQGETLADGQLSALFASKSLGRFVTLASMFGMN